MIRESVMRFAEHMERRLAANESKGHWSGCSEWYLFRRLQEETGELEEVLHELGGASSTVINEAADVANFAMMIADRARIEANKP